MVEHVEILVKHIEIAECLCCNGKGDKSNNFRIRYRRLSFSGGLGSEMWIRVRVVWRLSLAMTPSRRGGLGRQRLARLPVPFLSRLGSLA